MRSFRSFYWLLPILLLFSACAPSTLPAPTAAQPTTAQPTATQPLVPSPHPSDTTPQPSSTALPDAYLSEVSGEVAARPGESADFQPASPPQSLWVGTQIRTGEQGRARLDLTSGTILRLSPRTLFTLRENRPAETGLLTRAQLLLGEVFILLTGGGSVEVETDSGNAAVRGSYMLVSIPPEGGLRVQCLEGSCSLSTSFTSLELTGGQGVQVPSWSGQGEPPALQIFRLTEEDVRYWLENNPEVESILPVINATLTALPPLPSGTSILPTQIPVFPTQPWAFPTMPGGAPTDDDDYDPDYFPTPFPVFPSP